MKLSTAVDPWGSSLAVDVDSESRLQIWGLIDQSVHYSTYVAKESSSAPEMPGMFQAVIQATGEVAAYKSRVLLGSLKQDTLVKGQLRRSAVWPSPYETNEAYKAIPTACSR